MRTVVRTHEPPLARPVEFMRGVWHDLRKSPSLALEIAKRDIRGQYRSSLLGPTVVVLSPLALTAVAIGFRSTGILSVNAMSVPYPLFVLVGVVLWSTLIDAMNAPIHGFVAEQRLLAWTNAPPEAIMLGKLGTVFLNVFARGIVVAIAMVWYRNPLPAAALLVPFGLLGLAALGMAIGLVIAPMNLLYRDLSWMLITMTTLWFFFSPIYFAVPSSGAISVIMKFNPITSILSDTRSLLLTGSMASPSHSLLTILFGCLALAVCWIYARIALSVAIEQVNE